MVPRAHAPGVAAAMTERSALLAILGIAVPVALLAAIIAQFRRADSVAPGTPPFQQSSQPAGADRAAPPGSSDPSREIHPVIVAGLLAPELPLRLAPRGELHDLKPGSETRLFFATQRLYQGELTAAAASAVVSSGQADVLEHRLEELSALALRAELAQYDEALRDLALVIEDEEREIKSALRQRGDRCVVFHVTPIEIDPEFPRFRSLAPLSSEGTTWHEPDAGRQRVLIVLWAEWPGLKQLRDDRVAMLADRFLRVRRWIEARFRSEGMRIFRT